MGNKKINFRKNKKWRVFFIFLALSTLFWTMSKLSKEYTYLVKFKVKYTNLTKDKLLQNKPKEKLSILLKTTGFKLLGYNMTTETIHVNLEDVRQKDRAYYYMTNNHLADFQTQLSSEETIIRISPDTLFFDFGKLKSKIVNVRPNIKLSYKPGYNLLGEIKITPKTVKITGTEKIIDSIQYVTTKLVEIKNVSSNFKEKIALLVSQEIEQIHFSETKIEIEGKVEKFTEGTMKVQCEIKNIPKGYNIDTFSKKIKLTYKVSLENFNKVSASDFKVVCDYKKTEEDSLNYLLPVLTKQSNLVSDIKMAPKKIEFLIKK